MAKPRPLLIKSAFMLYRLIKFLSQIITGIVLPKVLLSLFMIGYFVTCALAQQKVIQADIMVKDFYSRLHQPIFWFSSAENINKASEWLKQIELADNLGIETDKSTCIQIRAKLLIINAKDISLKDSLDQQITGIVLNFLKVLQQGTIKFEYDEVSAPRDSVYINQLINFKSKESVSLIVSGLESKDHDYQVLKKYLNDSIGSLNELKHKEIVLAMNYRRYFTVNHQPDYIVVNIPATEAKYYRNDQLKLSMRTVVGTKKHPTPTIASYITNIVTFPHWNVPRSIAVKELLPKVQKNENYLEQNNYDVVNSKGKVVDDSDLDWKKYNENNFPYYFRQSTGSRNALGVLKFNLQNPFSIFLHSTSWIGVFAKDYRFLSHGCIRLQKPLDLAKLLLTDKIDIKQLKGGKKNTESKTIKLPHKLPVFIIYMPVKIVESKVIFLKDQYDLIQ